MALFQWCLWKQLLCGREPLACHLSHGYNNVYNGHLGNNHECPDFLGQLTNTNASSLDSQNTIVNYVHCTLKCITIKSLTFMLYIIGHPQLLDRHLNEVYSYLLMISLTGLAQPDSFKLCSTQVAHNSTLSLSYVHASKMSLPLWQGWLQYIKQHHHLAR